MATECDDLQQAEKWRRQIIGEVSRKVAQIQNGRLWLKWRRQIFGDKLRMVGKLQVQRYGSSFVSFHGGSLGRQWGVVIQVVH